jgi:hypothetical protein
MRRIEMLRKGSHVSTYLFYRETNMSDTKAIGPQIRGGTSGVRNY